MAVWVCMWQKQHLAMEQQTVVQLTAERSRALASASQSSRDAAATVQRLQDAHTTELAKLREQIVALQRECDTSQSRMAQLQRGARWFGGGFVFRFFRGAARVMRWGAGEERGSETERAAVHEIREHRSHSDGAGAA